MQLPDLELPLAARPPDPYKGRPHLVAGENRLDISFELGAAHPERTLAILFQPATRESEAIAPTFAVRHNGESIVPRIQEQKGSWSWLTIPLANGENDVRIDLARPRGAPRWRGTAEIWLECRRPRRQGVEVTFELAEPLGPERPLPPFRPALDYWADRIRTVEFDTE